MRSFVRGVKYFCGKEYMEMDLFEMPDMAERGKKISREKKSRPSTAAQKAMNKKRAIRKLERLIKTNFSTGTGYFVTLTFDDQHLPASIQDAEKSMKRFLDRLNHRLKRKHLPNAKWIYVIESKNKGHRFHIHLIINKVISRDELEQLWGNGMANCQNLHMEKVEALSSYLNKEVHEPNQKRWHRSRNLKEPVVKKNDFKYSHRKLRELSGLTDCPDVFEKECPGYTLIEAKSTFNEFTGWNIVAKFKKKEG